MDEFVNCKQGRLQGVKEEGVTAFKGLPYAAPPEGSLRFRAPQPAAPWRGVRRAAISAHAALQINAANSGQVQNIMNAWGELPGVRPGPPFAGITYAQPLVSEDCLYLDLWVPKREPGEKLAVYVYYHGGGNAAGAGSLHVERGAALAREERVIVVRPNYRLGALGWVHFGLVSSALPEACNLGVQDQIAALRWVSENIAAFGGDPGNITVGGESAGATAVSHLLVNPRARKLFRRVILQSFTPFHQWATHSRDEATAVANLCLRILAIDDPRELQTIEPDRLLAAGAALQRFMPVLHHGAWRPLGAVIDGTIVPHSPTARLCDETLDDTPPEVMIGVAKDEWQFFYGHTDEMKSATDEDFVKVFAQTLDESRARQLLAAYRAGYPDRQAGRLLADALAFEFFKLPALRMASQFARQGLRAHLFQFSYELPGQGGYLRASHTGDMPFIWRNLGPGDLARWPALEGIDAENAQRVARDFGALYGRFIRTGEPGADWPSFDPNDPQVLWFGQQVESRHGVFKAEFAIYEALGLTNIGDLEACLAQSTRDALQWKL